MVMNPPGNDETPGIYHNSALVMWVPNLCDIWKHADIWYGRYSASHKSKNVLQEMWARFIPGPDFSLVSSTQFVDEPDSPTGSPGNALLWMLKHLFDHWGRFIMCWPRPWICEYQFVFLLWCGKLLRLVHSAATLSSKNLTPEHEHWWTLRYILKCFLTFLEWLQMFQNS